MLTPWLATSAHAADAYRYWSYWWGGPDGAWEFAQTGPADRTVEDGDVEGWLFLVSADAVPAQQPREAADFATICSGNEQTAGQVRVAVVIDYGTDDSRPEGSTIPKGANPSASCVTLPEGSTGQQALAAAAQVRQEQGLTCGINNYPATGCGELVAEPAASPAPAAAPASGPNRLIWAAGGLLAVLAVVAVVVARSRKTPTA